MKNENNAAKQQNLGYESKNEVDEIQSVSLGWDGLEPKLKDRFGRS